MPKLSYHQQLTIDNTVKLREIIATLPPFVKDYFRAIEIRTSTKTRISYAYDIRVFISWLVTVNPVYKSVSPQGIKLEDLEKITAVDIEEYFEYLKCYQSNDGTYNTNSLEGISRKLSTLRNFYGYFCKHKRLNTNPTLLIDMPKKDKRKNIIRLEPNEVAALLDYMDNLEKQLSPKKLSYFQLTKYRDIAIITLLLGTGIRVSECIGINIDEIDFSNNGIKILRKGGHESIIYFGQEVATALQNYLSLTRNNITAVSGHENALFLSLQKKRISVDAVEDLVKKYTKSVTPLKKITPHKLRSTFGTTLYQETGDIYLVADALGHSSVEVTRKHYAAIEDSRRRSVSNLVKLRAK